VRVCVCVCIYICVCVCVCVYVCYELCLGGTQKHTVDKVAKRGRNEDAVNSLPHPSIVPSLATQTHTNTHTHTHTQRDRETDRHTHIHTRTHPYTHFPSLSLCPSSASLASLPPPLPPSPCVPLCVRLAMARSGGAGASGGLPGAASRGARYKFFRRLLQVQQMDFELALHQMFHLLVAPPRGLPQLLLPQE